MNLQDIQFPVFQLGEHDRIETISNITYVYRADQQLILDNKNLHGDTLGKRRLRILDKDKIFKLSKRYNSIIELIKFKGGKNKFVDNNGKVFKYTKTKRSKVIYKKIIAQKNIPNIGIRIRLINDLDFIISPTYGYVVGQYAGLLIFNADYLLFEITREYKDDTIKWY